MKKIDKTTEYDEEKLDRLAFEVWAKPALMEYLADRGAVLITAHGMDESGENVKLTVDAFNVDKDQARALLLLGAETAGEI